MNVTIALSGIDEGKVLNMIVLSNFVSTSFTQMGFFQFMPVVHKFRHSIVSY